MSKPALKPGEQRRRVVTGQISNGELRKMFRAENIVDHYDREPKELA
jgi:hypothetical protein